MGCYYLGYAYYCGNGVKRDTDRTLKFYKLACDGGSAQGCYDSGVLFDEGKDVAQNYERAATCYQRACEMDLPNGEGEAEAAAKSCSNLGVLYEKGRGVATDLKRAVELFGRACHGGNAIGCLNSGNMYARGAGLPRNLDKAEEIFKKLCDQGSADMVWVGGCRGLAGVLVEREGGKTNPTAAIAHLEKECAAGKPQPCYAAALMLEIGDMIPADKNRAAGLYRKACQKSYEAGCVELKRLGEAASLPVPKKSESCQAECKRLFEQKELRDGVTVDKCVADLCHPPLELKAR